MMNAKRGTASTNAANRRWSCATDQIATRLPTRGKRRYSASTYGVARAVASASAFSAAMPSARGVASTLAAGARYGSLYSRLTSVDAIQTAPANIRSPATGPRSTRSLRLIAPFITPFVTVLPSIDGRGGACGAFQALAFEFSHVGDDRPPVCGRDRPPVPGHQPRHVGNDVEELPVRILQDLVMVKGRGGDVASLEQDPLAVPPSVVTRLAIDRRPLAAAFDKNRVDRHRHARDELAVCSLPREEDGVLLDPADCDRSWNRLAHGRAVTEERAGRLREHLRLVVHARIEMDGRTARRAATRTPGEPENRRESNCGAERP